MCEHTRTVAAADNTGQVSTLAVDFVRPARGADTRRNGTGQCARGCAISTGVFLAHYWSRLTVQTVPRKTEESHVLAMEHFIYGNSSLLACTTTAGEIEGWDLRSPSMVSEY